MDKDLRFSHAATIIPVTDMERSLAYYRDQLGFEVMFTWMDPIDYAVLRKDNVSIHLTLRAGDISHSGHSAVQIFVYDVDAVYSDLIGRGADISQEIGDREYGMRDFDVKDPDGHLLCFGMGIN